MLASGSMIRTTISSTSPTRWVLRRSSITTTKTTPIASWGASSTAARSADWPLCGRRDRELDELERLQAETGRGESRSCSAEDVLGYPIERSPNVRPGAAQRPPCAAAPPYARRETLLRLAAMRRGGPSGQNNAYPTSP